MDAEEWIISSERAVQSAKDDLFKRFFESDNGFFWKEEDVQSYLFYLLLRQDPFRSDLEKGYLRIHREYPTRAHYAGSGYKYRQIPRDSNKKRGSFDLVVLHPDASGYSWKHPILHGIEIKFLRVFQTGFSKESINGITGKIYPDYLKLTEPENQITPRDHRHLLLLLRKETKKKMPGERTVHDVIRTIEDNERVHIRMENLRFSIVVLGPEGEALGPLNNYEP